MSASEALTIWMFSTAMKAPMVAPITAVHIRGPDRPLGLAIAGAPRCWKQDAAAAGAGERRERRTDYCAGVEDGAGARVSMLGSTDIPARSPAAAGLCSML